LFLLVLYLVQLNVIHNLGLFVCVRSNTTYISSYTKDNFLRIVSLVKDDLTRPTKRGLPLNPIQQERHFLELEFFCLSSNPCVPYRKE
jgi:hypothetical protein